MAVTRRVLPFLACAIFLRGWCLGPAVAQRAPLNGVVWEEPADSAQAARDLTRMRYWGVEAVRMGLVRTDGLLTLADSLGLQIFQDLPFEDLSASALRDSTAAALALADEALRRFRRHPSARHFGLAARSDTSDPRACAFFETLAARFRELAGIRVFYTTAFIEDDVCAEAVDFVLLDVRGAEDPAAALRRWNGYRAPLRAGIGAVGIGAEYGAFGLRHPRSPESQARYLETHLEALRAGAAAAVFVHRWRNRDASAAADALVGGPQSWGLVTGAGAERPSAEVLRGLYTGTQRTFAFPYGAPPSEPPPWTVLLGWLPFIALVLCYATSPRFPGLAARYFLAHGYYLDLLRKGREVTFGPAVALFCALSAAVGVIGSSALESARYTAAFAYLYHAAPEPARRAVVRLLADPALLTLTVASLHACWIALWATALSASLRSTLRLQGKQVLMTVLFPLWPVFVLLAAAMAAGAELQPELLLACLAADLWATVHSLRDYAAITLPRPFLHVALACLRPGAAVLVAAAALLLAVPELRAEAAFFWHLATRS